MDIQSVTKAAEALGLKSRPGDEGTIGIEIPRDSGKYILARPSKDGLAWVLVAGVEISERSLGAFSASTTRECARASADIGAYLSLFDIEYDFDYFGSIPRSVSIAARWVPETGPQGLVTSLKTLMRTKEGTMHKIRYWVATLSDITNEGHGTDAVEIEGSDSLPEPA